MEEIKYLIITILLETPAALAFLYKEKWTQVFFVVISVNAVTHPLAWLFVWHGANWWLVETFITFFESSILLWIFPRTPIRSFLAGVLMNITSAAIGLMI